MATVNMSEGRIWKVLSSYSFTLVLGNLFQLFYNLMDSVIVGRFIGKDALAAVGSSSPVINIAILGISGLCIGSSVLMSRFFGGRDHEKLKREFSTMLLFGLLFSLAISVLGFAFSRPLLRALNVPSQILSISSYYLRIIFIGTPFTYFYNALSYAMKSVGDSKTPLKFLALSSVLNIVLDLILIGYFGFGIICSAITTVVAQFLSAFLCFVYIYRKMPILALRAREFKIDGKLLKQTLSYGSVTALQQSIQPICKLLIQGSINTLGVDGMAAYNAVGKVDDFAFTPEQGIAQGITTFVAQNEGAGKKERAIKGFKVGMLIECIYYVFICLVSLLFRRQIITLFVSSSETEVIDIGSKYLFLMSFMYILPAMTNGIQGFFRGIGKMWVTLVSTFIQASTRVVFVNLLIGKLGIISVVVASVIGWILMLLFEVPLYINYYLKQKRSLRQKT